jgi:hypothetical protein
VDVWAGKVNPDWIKPSFRNLRRQKGEACSIALHRYMMRIWKAKLEDIWRHYTDFDC